MSEARIQEVNHVNKNIYGKTFQYSIAIPLLTQGKARKEQEGLIRKVVYGKKSSS